MPRTEEPVFFFFSGEDGSGAGGLCRWVPSQADPSVPGQYRRGHEERQDEQRGPPVRDTASEGECEVGALHVAQHVHVGSVRGHDQCHGGQGRGAIRACLGDRCADQSVREVVQEPSSRA